MLGDNRSQELKAIRYQYVMMRVTSESENDAGLSWDVKYGRLPPSIHTLKAINKRTDIVRTIILNKRGLKVSTSCNFLSLMNLQSNLLLITKQS